jgi:[ribosomal protein S18]-alanine N-acetyltransferase
LSDSIAAQEGPLAGLSFTPMTRALAEQIIEWRYPDYPLFNVAPEEAEAEIRVLLEPAYRYHVALNAAGEAVGFCCFGEDARVPGGDYDREEALDVGLGLRPDLTGKGLGLMFLQAILEFGKTQLAARRFRATIAVFNVRSRRIFEQAGFTLRQTFYSGITRPLAFVILVKEVKANQRAQQ